MTRDYYGRPEYRWDYPGIKRGCSLPAPRPITIRKDEQLRRLGRGLEFDYPEGKVAVQVVDRADWSRVSPGLRRSGVSDVFWVTVFVCDDIPVSGEFRLLWTWNDGRMGLSKESYAADGRELR